MSGFRFAPRLIKQGQMQFGDPIPSPWTHRSRSFMKRAMPIELQQPPSPGRRHVLLSAAMASAATLLTWAGGGVLPAAAAPPTGTETEIVRDTFNGLIAFVVPGRDAYSSAQDVNSPTEGGVNMGITDELIATLDDTTPFVPQFSATVAGVLNGLALAVAPGSAGALFVSPFANLSFAQKAAVFQIMDGTDSLKLLAGILPPFVAFFCYSEASAFDPVTRSLNGVPLGWQLSSYQGVAEGRNEFLGYLAGGRVDSSPGDGHA